MLKIMAGMAVIQSVKMLRIASRSEKTASELVPAGSDKGCSEKLFKYEPHKLHLFAESGFSALHFGHFMLSS